jgi:glycine/D-amino acid oxidase-like deaminating enzyme
MPRPRTTLDLAVIGGGIMGLFTAYYASQFTRRVTIFERTRVGDPQTASFGLTRSIRNDYLDPVYARLAYESRQLWLELQARSGQPLLIECGCLNVAKASVTPDLSATYAEQSYRMLTQLRLRTQVFTRQGMARRYPQFDVDLGRLDVEAGFLYLPAVTGVLRAALRERGVAIEEAANLERLVVGPREVEITAAARTWSAGAVVLTSGLGTNDLLSRIEGCDLRFPLRPDRPRETKYVVPPADQRALFSAPRLPVFAYLDIGIYGHPIYEGRTPGVKISYYHPPELEPSGASIRDVRGFIEECLPRLRGAQMMDVSGVDQCSYDLTADDDFIVGPLPGFPRIAVGVGWHGTGYKFGPLMGRALMQTALEGGTAYDLRRFSPERFPASA